MDIGIIGICGRMGKILADTINNSTDFKITFGIDPQVSDFMKDVFLYCKCDNITRTADVIIDFSNHSNIEQVLDLAIKKNTPLVIGTTGHTTEELMKIYEASKNIPILLSPNTSLGATYLTNAAVLGAQFFASKNYEIDISETHHSKKVDIPSGTALTILNAILSVAPSLKPIQNISGKRENDQITITSKRLGEIAGIHEISFAGEGEILTIKHEVLDRKIFALGALECAKFIKDKSAGFYKMTDMIKTVSPCKCGRNCKCNNEYQK